MGWVVDIPSVGVNVKEQNSKASDYFDAGELLLLPFFELDPQYT